MNNELDSARYISLATFKRNGTGVASAVWITGTGGAYAFTTGHVAWKTKRLHHNPAVEVRVCDFRGRVKPGASTYTGTGEVLASAEAITAVERALATKYGWQFGLTKVADRVKSMFGRQVKQDVVAIHLHVQTE